MSPLGTGFVCCWLPNRRDLEMGPVEGASGLGKASPGVVCLVIATNISLRSPLWAVPGLVFCPPAKR